MNSLDIFILVILGLVNVIAIPAALPPYLLPTKPQSHTSEQQNPQDINISTDDVEKVFNKLDEGNALKGSYSLFTAEQNVLNENKNKKRDKEKEKETETPGSRKFDAAAQKALKVVKPEEKIRDIWAKAGMRSKAAEVDEKHGEGSKKKKGAGGVDRKAEILILKAEAEKRIRGKELVKEIKKSDGEVKESSISKEEKRNGKSRHDTEAEKALEKAFPGTHRRPEKRDMLSLDEKNEISSVSGNKEAAALAATKDLHVSADVPADEFVSSAIAKMIPSEKKHGKHGNHGQSAVLQSPFSAVGSELPLDLSSAKDKNTEDGAVEYAVAEKKNGADNKKVELVDMQRKKMDVDKEVGEAQKPMLAEKMGELRHPGTRSERRLNS